MTLSLCGLVTFGQSQPPTGSYRHIRHLTLDKSDYTSQMSNYCVNQPYRKCCFPTVIPHTSQNPVTTREWPLLTIQQCSTGPQQHWAGAINLIAVSRVETLRQQRRGRIETTNKVMLAEWDPLHSLSPLSHCHMPLYMFPHSITGRSSPSEINELA